LGIDMLVMNLQTGVGVLEGGFGDSGSIDVYRSLSPFHMASTKIDISVYRILISLEIYSDYH